MSQMRDRGPHLYRGDIDGILKKYNSASSETGSYGTVKISGNEAIKILKCDPRAPYEDGDDDDETDTKDVVVNCERAKDEGRRATQAGELGIGPTVLFTGLTEDERTYVIEYAVAKGTPGDALAFKEQLNSRSEEKRSAKKRLRSDTLSLRSLSLDDSPSAAEAPPLATSPPRSPPASLQSMTPPATPTQTPPATPTQRTTPPATPASPHTENDAMRLLKGLLKATRIMVNAKPPLYHPDLTPNNIFLHGENIHIIDWDPIFKSPDAARMVQGLKMGIFAVLSSWNTFDVQGASTEEAKARAIEARQIARQIFELLELSATQIDAILDIHPRRQRL